MFKQSLFLTIPNQLKSNLSEVWLTQALVVPRVSISFTIRSVVGFSIAFHCLFTKTETLYLGTSACSVKPDKG